MNIHYAHELLAAADGQRHGFIKLRGRRAENEVKEMAVAGLIDATISDGSAGAFTSINRLTAAGQNFLRAFVDKPLPRESSELGPCTTVMEKWKVQFAAGLPAANLKAKSE